MKEYNKQLEIAKNSFEKIGFLTELVAFSHILDRDTKEFILNNFPDNQNINIVKNLPDLFVLHKEVPNGYLITPERQFAKEKHNKKIVYEKTLSPEYGAFFVIIKDNISGSFSSNQLSIFNNFYPTDKISIFSHHKSTNYCEWLVDCLREQQFELKKTFREFLFGLGIRREDG